MKELTPWTPASPFEQSLARTVIESATAWWRTRNVLPGITWEECDNGWYRMEPRPFDPDDLMDLLNYPHVVGRIGIIEQDGQAVVWFEVSNDQEGMKMQPEIQAVEQTKARERVPGLTYTRIVEVQ